jgi:hypothetical protein
MSNILENEIIEEPTGPFFYQKNGFAYCTL